jgi:hypothetical protein
MMYISKYNDKIINMNIKRLIIILLATLFTYAGLSYFVTTSTQTQFLQNMFLKIKKVASNNDAYPLIIPKIQPVTDETFAEVNHFKGKDGFFVFVKTDFSSKQAPNLESDDYKKLYETQRVRVLFEKKQANTYDNIENIWMFIANEKGDTYLGWVFKDNLVFQDDFERFNSDQFYDFSYTKGEFSANVKMRGRGRFTLNWKSEGGGLFLEGVDKGRLYMYDKIIWVKKYNQDYIYEFFKLDDTNHLHHEFKYRFDDIKLDIYTMPDEKTFKE